MFRNWLLTTWSGSKSPNSLWRRCRIESLYYDLISAWNNTKDISVWNAECSLCTATSRWTRSTFLLHFFLQGFDLFKRKLGTFLNIFGFSVVREISWALAEAKGHDIVLTLSFSVVYYINIDLCCKKSQFCTEMLILSGIRNMVSLYCMLMQYKNQVKG